MLNLYDHQSKQCNEMSVPEKREKLRKQGRCVVCFGTRHVAKDCPTKGTLGETELTDIMTEAFVPMMEMNCQK